MPVAVAFLNYALKNNLHVAALLVVICAIMVYAIVRFRESEIITAHKFDFIGLKLVAISDKLDAVSLKVEKHDDDIKEIKVTLAEKFKQRRV